MTSDPLRRQAHDDWFDVDTESDADLDADEIVLPAVPQWRRCSVVHCIEQGPWVGTLVCCIRQSGHKDGHSVPLGDVGSPDYWLEIWL